MEAKEATGIDADEAGDHSDQNASSGVASTRTIPTTNTEGTTRPPPSTTATDPGPMDVDNEANEAPPTVVVSTGTKNDPKESVIVEEQPAYESQTHTNKNDEATTTAVKQPKVESNELGDDQVEKDQPRQPLTVSAATSKLDASQTAANTTQNRPSVSTKPPPPATIAPKAVPVAPKPAPVAAAPSTAATMPPPMTEPPISMSSLKPPPQPVAPPTDSPSLALMQARAPLTNLYGPFLSDTDTCLEDARQRLMTAIRQTQKLRQAFTDRVYQKYRVCLYPAPPAESTIAQIKADPAAASKKLSEDRLMLKSEKELEKKEAQKLNAELSAAPTAALNIDTADQLLYYTAGLNLIILPEDTTASKESLAPYAERGPINESGQRAKNVSQAAALAGESMLDRTRKASAMRVERQRRKQLQLLSGEADTSTYSRLQVLSTANSTAPGSAAAAPLRSDAGAFSSATGASKRSKSIDAIKPMVGGKGARARSQSSIPTATLLSIAPAADEICKDRPASSAATAALQARAGGVLKTTQQRLKHPHPESLGGRRRASVNPAAAKKDVPSTGAPVTATTNEPFLQAYLALTLPPLPATKERLERKPLPVCTLEEASTGRAKAAVKAVLKEFVSDEGSSVLRSSTKIQLMHTFRQLSSERKEKLATTDPAPPPQTTAVPAHPPNTVPIFRPQSMVPGGGSSPDSPIDPIVAFSVLRAVGLIRSSADSNDASQAIREIKGESSVWSDKLKRLNERIRSSKRPLTERLFSNAENKSSEVASTDDTETRPAKQRRLDDGKVEGTQAPVESIRGGGEVLVDGADDATRPVGDKAEAKQEATASEKKSVTMAPADDKNEQKSESKRLVKPSAKAAAKRKYSDPGSVAAHRHRKYSDPGRENQTAVTPAPVRGMSGAYSNQIAGQLRSHHPAGELADYIGNLSQPRPGGYDMSALMQARHGGPPMGMMQPGPGMVGYDGSAAARALYARDQHTAALLGSNYPPAASYAHVTAMLGPPPTGPMMHGQYAVPTAPGHMHPPMPYPSAAQYAIPANPATGQNSRNSSGSKPSTESGAGARAQNEREKSTTSTVPSKDPAAGSATNGAPANDDGAEETQELASKDDKNKDNTDDESPVPDGKAKAKSTTSTEVKGMKSFEPERPSEVDPKDAELIKGGKFHQVVASISDAESRNAAVDFLCSLGAAIPIPKALISNPLKDRLNTPGFKNMGSTGTPNVPRDHVVATILVWLWANHEETFQQAFDKSGRIDVEPGCKWLIQAAVDTAVRALSLDIAESVARGEGPFAESMAARKGQSGLKPTSGAPTADVDQSALAKKVELHTALIVNKALSAEMSVSEAMNVVIPEFQTYIEYLDEARLCSLRAKAQERTMLASLLARRATMTEPFSHAYTSACVRAGEALGHDELFETVQDQETATSSMMPYDVFTAEGDYWEDPCKPNDGFNPGLTGDDLMRRAHARAMIQKSLRKLQDRNNIRGGATSYGPYVDPSIAEATTAPVAPVDVTASASRKRRASSFGETTAPAGTGSARARNWSVYEPNHFSEPLEWDNRRTESMPYGLHRVGERLRSLSVSLSARSGEPRSIKKAKRSTSLSTTQLHIVNDKPLAAGEIPKSTREIDWADVAGIFQSVELPRKSPPTKTASAASGKSEGDTSGAANRTIFAPYCRKFDKVTTEDDESDTEEDLSEEAILARHEVVLDNMKTKLSAFLEARKKQQERRKKQASKS